MIENEELGGSEDRAKLKLFILWLQQRDVFLYKVGVGEKPKICIKTPDLADKFCDFLKNPNSTPTEKAQIGRD